MIPRVTALLFTVLVAVCLPGVSRAASRPLGLPPIAQATTQEAELAHIGELLFADRRLSIDGSVSCASCHLPQNKFTDQRPTGHGLHGLSLTRRTPRLANVRFASSLFWDGRATTLETQARTPLLGTIEHGLLSEKAAVRVVLDNDRYVRDFRHVPATRGKSEISFADVTAALAAYERTLLSGDSPADRFLFANDKSSLSASAQRGLQLFRGRAQCSHCHTIDETSALLTDNDFHSSPNPLPSTTLDRLGDLTHEVARLRAQGETAQLNNLIASDRDVAALGRFVVTLNPKDIGCFKTPSLRNVARTPPYMHDGSVATLAGAVDSELYSRSTLNDPLVLTEDERSDLLAFLEALTSP